MSDRGPNRQYQMFTREGNDAVADAVAATVAHAQAYPGQPRDTLLQMLRSNLRMVSRAGHSEWTDTEPRGAIVDAVNAYLAATGWRDITDDDLFAPSVEISGRRVFKGTTGNS